MINNCPVEDMVVPESVLSVDPFDDVLVFATDMDYDLDQKEILEVTQSIKNRLAEATYEPMDKKVENTDCPASTWAETIQNRIASIVGVVAEALFLNRGKDETKTNCAKEPVQGTSKLSLTHQECLEQRDTELQETPLPDLDPLPVDWRAIAVLDPDSLLKQQQQQPIYRHQETGNRPDPPVSIDSLRQLRKLQFQASIGSEIEDDDEYYQPINESDTTDSWRQVPVLQVQAATSFGGSENEDDKYQPIDQLDTPSVTDSSQQFPNLQIQAATRSSFESEYENDKYQLINNQTRFLPLIRRNSTTNASLSTTHIITTSIRYLLFKFILRLIMTARNTNMTSKTERLWCGRNTLDLEISHLSRRHRTACNGSVWKYPECRLGIREF